MDTTNSSYFVNSVAKGLSVLMAFDSQDRQMTITELEKKTNINKATVRRFALTLVDLGYLTITDNNKFELTPKVLDLAARYLESLNLPDIAHPILERISSVVKESTNLAVLDEAEIVYVVRVNAAERIIGTNLRVGSRLPYYATSLGKAISAWLPEDKRKEIWEQANIVAFTNNTITDFEEFEKELEEIRLNGYANGNNELEIGLRSIAVPIFNKKGEVIASINVSSNSIRTSEEKLKNEFLPLIIQGAEEINQLIKTFS
ncbi:IclR family transcriptional regulator domain-containing protein [Ureibacillus endophyticus]|uniref:IclR family transcriptional regulator n=1 Tax=Ureibacillus endophyticus TaxID=1978490 RepID=A0A494Z0C2_9BACL|nr:IclR family transcriptional regulator C-terminal domain-containing protein [Lysinibacillus endophyticus]RKQ15967.1 IclR family transcriptional regulator [Lysinibacillus endophyticus]